MIAGISIKNVIVFIALTVGFYACDAGAKKLERKPKTRVRVVEKVEKELVSIYESPAPSTVYKRMVKKQSKWKNSVIELNDTLVSPAFKLGELLSELTFSVESKDHKKMAGNLRQIQLVYERLQLADTNLNTLMLLPEKVLLKHKELITFSSEFYSNTIELLRMYARESDLAALKVGVYVHQMNFILKNQTQIDSVIFEELLQFQRASAQNLLVSLVDLKGEEKFELFREKIHQILSCFDRLKQDGTPEVVFKDENDVYLIRGGFNYKLDEKVLVDLEQLLANFHQLN